MRVALAVPAGPFAAPAAITGALAVALMRGALAEVAHAVVLRQGARVPAVVLLKAGDLTAVMSPDTARAVAGYVAADPLFALALGDAEGELAFDLAERLRREAADADDYSAEAAA